MTTNSNKPETSGFVAERVTNALMGPGSPLEPSTRRFMESRFGFDFTEVRIHASEKANVDAGV